MEQKQQWGSRFGYLMVAAGASIGLGNIWKFPYLAYRGGGGVFLVVYLLVVLALAKPMVEMETAIGRHSGLDTVTAFECINPRWGFVGWIGNLCTIMINFYYVVVGGWVLRYLCQFIFVGNFGGDPSAFFKGFTSDPVQPIIWSMILLIFVSAMLLFGITTKVERLAKFIMPALILMLIICGVYACTITDGAAGGLKYYLLPDFSKFTVKVFADAVTQVLFSVGIGWSLFITLGANIPKKNNLRERRSVRKLCRYLCRCSRGLRHHPLRLRRRHRRSERPGPRIRGHVRHIPQPARRAHNRQLLLPCADIRGHLIPVQLLRDKYPNRRSKAKDGPQKGHIDNRHHNRHRQHISYRWASAP